MSIRYTKSSNSLQLDSQSTPITNMAKPSQADIEQMIQYARPTNRDLARRDINQVINASISSLLLKVASHVYSNGTSKELLCLHGTVACQYRGARYNIPIEIWLQQDHPIVPPLAYVRPTSDMYVSPKSADVQPDGTVIISYLRNWRHPQSDLFTLVNAMSEAFSQSPPVYSCSSGNQRPTNPTTYPTYSTPYPTNSASYPTPYSTNPTSYSTPYPTNPSMPMPTVGNTSYSYPYGYPPTTTTIPEEHYRDSIQSAVLDKVRYEFDEIVPLRNAEIDSLKKTEQDLLKGEKIIQSLISNAQQEQVQTQNHIANLRTKINEMSEAAQKKPSSGKDNAVKDDAIITSAPVYKQLLQAYAEEHAIQDLLYYLADGLRRQSIGLDTYLKHVRELSRKQFMLRATMHKCRHVAGLPIK